ncbi:spermidine/putrescine transport system substrate-binding protein [Mycoplasmopsis mustelae]|uniref:Spermidine/putrescine transport system substrate-binding protein n=1 Tax=Mycoplasmopsis mustelae TaxID=171289 RepID=A0A4R7UEY2_9BACT|nr:hypothetical protein [Mycoplasmopsis mustelae]TDV24453.1 spermidine/putrescine transport system substrate-binding protein [Mycoplasmopsis mustelae]
MEKIKEFFSIKNIKKITISIVLLLIGIFVISISSYKATHQFKPAFYNYKSYIEKETVEPALSENFEYKEFNEINEFTIALSNHKAVAGIGSDFQAIALIHKGLIKKINFNQLLMPQEPIKTETDLKIALQKIYTPVVFAHLSAYDDELKDLGKENDGTYRHLWEYFVPYYVQDAVFAYNPLKQKDQKEITNEILEKNLRKTIQEYSKKDGWNTIDKYLKPNSLFNIIRTANSLGYNQLVITDAVRANMLYGSSFNFPNKNNTLTTHTGDVCEENYQQQINNFVNLINSSTDTKITSSKKVSFNPDGQGIIASLLDMNRNDVNSAIMYNGDALDAYYSDDNNFKAFYTKEDEVTGKQIKVEKTIEDGTIQSIKFNENILLVDGLVVAQKISEPTEKQLYNMLSKTLYNNLNDGQTYGVETAMINLYDTYLSYAFRDELLQELASKNKNKTIDKNADYFNNLKNELIKIYKTTIENKPNNTDLKKFNIFVKNKIISNELLKNAFMNILDINEVKTENVINKIAFSLSHIDFSNENFKEYLSKKYLNLINFDFIGYTPTTNVDYKIILRNYFINDDNTYDQKVIKIYEIDLNDKTINHEKIGGVNDKLNSELNTYFYFKTKR